jgi:hypothetical protein
MTALCYRQPVPGFEPQQTHLTTVVTVTYKHSVITTQPTGETIPLGHGFLWFFSLIGEISWLY